METDEDGYYRNCSYCPRQSIGDFNRRLPQGLKKIAEDNCDRRQSPWFAETIVLASNRRFVFLLQRRKYLHEIWDTTLAVIDILKESFTDLFYSHMEFQHINLEAYNLIGSIKWHRTKFHLINYHLLVYAFEDFKSRSGPSYRINLCLLSVDVPKKGFKFSDLVELDEQRGRSFPNLDDSLRIEVGFGQRIVVRDLFVGRCYVYIVENERLVFVESYSTPRYDLNRPYGVGEYDQKSYHFVYYPEKEMIDYANVLVKNLRDPDEAPQLLPTDCPYKELNSARLCFLTNLKN